MSARTSDRPRDRIGPYRIEQKIGEGGMGAVYRAWDERLKRPVAVKHILPEVDDPLLRERFRREAQAAACLNHSAIVHIYDIVEDDLGDWIVMELVEGRRLDLVLRRGALELNHAMRFARELARGLAEAHAKGVVHRDLKAENVMVTRDGHAKILDFGLAKLAHELQDPGLSTTQGAVLGTARVMSPEQAMGLGVDQRSDLFSLGTLLYEVFTGSSPFKADAVVETLKRVCTMRQKAAESLREEIPTEMSRLIDHLLEKDPEKRPRNAREVIAALVRISETHVPESLDETQSGVSMRLDSSDEASGAASSQGDDSVGLTDSTTAPHRPFAYRDDAATDPEDTTFDPELGATRPAWSEISPTLFSPNLPRLPRRAASPQDPAPASRTTPAHGHTVSRTFALEATAHDLARFRQLGERRQVTVLCCDLLGERPGNAFRVLDPEALFDVLPDFRALAMRTIRGFEGHLGKMLGHRLWAFFGYPRAHEDDAERAVRAALELVAGARELEAPWQEGNHARLGVRVGIHTGPAVVTPERTSEDEIALGPTLDLASGVHEIAELHGVAVSHETERLVHEVFVTEPMASVRCRGLDRACASHRVVALRDPRSRLEDFGRLVPIVGRRDELDLLVALWDRVRRGTGQVVFVSGDAGIGKTRLVQALRERSKAEDPPWWIGVGSAWTRNSPLLPMAELLRGLLDDGSGRPLTDLLEETLEAHGFSLPEFVPLFADLLKLPLARRYRPLRSTAARRRARTIEVLIALILEKAERRAAVMVIEDLQWVDPSTLELLDLLLGQVAAAPLLLVLTHRSDFELPWPPRSDAHYVALEPLADAEGRILIANVAGSRALPGPIREKILARTDGVPLFLEEMTRSVLESDLHSSPDERSGVTPSTQVMIPATLRDSLAARLDLLSSAKALIQRAAVIGRKFTYDLLFAVSRLEKARFDQELDQLVRSGLVHREAAPPPGGYLFKSVLIQTVAYRSLLRRERQQIHLDVAQALESAAGDGGEVPHEVLARHYTRARRPERAVAYWLDAGRAAVERSANVEAIEFLRRGLSLLGAFSPGGLRDSMELGLECVLVTALAAVEGDTAPEVRQVMERAYELSRELADTPGMFWAIWALWNQHLMRGNSEQALELARRLLRQTEGDATEHDATVAGGPKLHASFAAGMTLYFRGELAGAKEILTSALALDEVRLSSPAALERSGRDVPALSQAGQDAGLGARSILALTLWHLGSPDRALDLSEQALGAARRLGHPYTLAFALQAHAWLLLYRGDVDALFHRSQELIVLCREQNLRFAVVGDFLRECARIRFHLRAPTGGRDAATELVQGQERALQGLLASGVVLALRAGFCHATEHCARLGRPALGIGLLERAGDAEDGWHWTCEVHRLRGQLALADDGIDLPDRRQRAEECFERALAEARDRGEVSLALRAATDLAGLWRDQGKAGQARELLERALEDVEGGTATTDHERATAALEALND